MPRALRRGRAYLHGVTSPRRTPDGLSPALEHLVARFSRMVRSVGARHGLSEADLDEVVQDVRIRLWRSGATSEQIAALGASYIYRTAATAALDLLRRRRAHGAVLTDSLDTHAERLVAEPRAPGELAMHDLEQRVAEALSSIPLSRRAVVRMYLSGYEREEIADLLGWSEAKTRNLLYRGLADLRARLGGPSGEDDRNA